MALSTLKHAILKKSHTCDEGGGHLRIFVWHLFMNLRNNYLLVYQKSWWYDLQFLRYRVWQTEIGNYRSFSPLLPTPFPPPCFLKTWKIKILKKWKKLLEISSFYIYVPKIGSVLEIRSETETFLSFWAIFLAFYPLTAQKSKFLKNEKATWRHHHFAHVYQKLWSHDVRFLRYGARRMDRRTDGRKKWHNFFISLVSVDNLRNFFSRFTKPP